MNIGYNYDSLNTNFKGKIIYKNKISKEGQLLQNDFLSMKKDGKTNFEIIKNKTYDLYISENLGNLTLTTNYKKLFVSKPQEYYLVGIKANEKEEDLNLHTNFFRWGLKTFQEHKKDFNGYNNTFEKIKAAIKEFCYEIDIN